MKYIISSVLVLVLSIGSLYAGEESEYKKDSSEPYSEVEKFEGDFSVVLNDDNTVTASWDDFNGEGFDWYKLMYSTTNSAPVYPKDHVAFIGNAEQTESTFKLKYGKNHYIRICAITVEQNYRKGLYCSDVTKLEADVTGIVKKVVEKKKEQVKEYKQEYKEKTEEKKSEVSTRLKEKVHAMVEKFMDRLESKGYSTDQKIEVVEKVITKLENLKDKKPRYERLVGYIIEKFEAQLSEIDDGVDAIEDILNDF